MISNSTPDYRKVVMQYCDAVLSGDRVCGRFEIYGVKRFLHDLEHAAERGFYMDWDRAQFCCAFFDENLTHSIGEFQGQRFTLDPWQAFCWANIQGWRDADTKLRRFRKAYITVGRKNGKTTFLAGAALQTLYRDEPAEPVCRSFVAATKKEQAALMWEEARRMAESTAWGRRRFRIRGGDNIAGGSIIVQYGAQKGSRFIPVGSDSRNQSGLNVSHVFKDELHEWIDKHRGLHEKLSTAGGSRRQSLECIATTSGDDNSVIWEEEQEFAERVVEAGSRGEVISDAHFCYICQIDEEDDPLDFSCWPKANPNLGVSVKEDYLRAQLDEAIHKPSARNQVIRYHCNRRTASFEQAYPQHLWERGIELPEPKKRDLCFIGFDLSLVNDWTAVAAVFPQWDGEQWVYKIKTKSWCCKGLNSTTDYTQPPYSLWIQQGHLEFQPGNEVIDKAPIRAYLMELLRTYRVKEIAYDKYGADELAVDLANQIGRKIKAEDFPQTPLRFHEPLESFESALIAGRIDHGNDPVLNWQAANCQIVQNAGGRKMLDKGNQHRWKKIDAMVSVIMAYGQGIRYTRKRKKGVKAFQL